MSLKVVDALAHSSISQLGYEKTSILHETVGTKVLVFLNENFHVPDTAVSAILTPHHDSPETGGHYEFCTTHNKLAHPILLAQKRILHSAFTSTYVRATNAKCIKPSRSNYSTR